jgi:hypothetical protein
MNRLKSALSPSTKLGKFCRDGLVMTAAAMLGYVINNWTSLVDALNDATGDKVPALLLAWAFSLALLASRWLREQGTSTAQE